MKAKMKAYKSYRLLPPALMLALIASAGCGKSDDNSARIEADALYRNVVSLTRKYTDSLRLAKDSTTVNGLMLRYEAAIARLNMDAPPETDFNLTEDQNDTIHALQKRMLGLRDNILKKKVHLAADTVEGESESDSLTLKPER